MIKKVAMVPVRLGSRRVKNKNLRMLSGKPLVEHIITACIKSNAFDEIYVNSESEVFEPIAHRLGVKFYKRDPYLAQSHVKTDEFGYDFAKNVPSDYFYQVLATAPLLSANDIKNFVDYQIENGFETCLSVYEEHIECFYKGKPVNFSMKSQFVSSEEIEPLFVCTWGITGWKTETFVSNFEKYGYGAYGNLRSLGFFPVSKIASVDIDEEDDFTLAEALMALTEKKKVEDAKGHVETDVVKILEKDRVDYADMFRANLPVINISHIVEEKRGHKSWCRRVINTDNNSASLICQQPGEGNRRHYHDDWNEWWYIVDGEWEWEIEGKTMIVSKGDIIFIEKGKLHKITAAGNKPAMRLAVSRDNVAHIYPEE
jgi:CMP-N-acetylneuraminic acid synthetase/quercetin dioxygenase-like cupin family protein